MLFHSATRLGTVRALPRGRAALATNATRTTMAPPAKVSPLSLTVESSRRSESLRAQSASGRWSAATTATARRRATVRAVTTTRARRATSARLAIGATPTASPARAWSAIRRAAASAPAMPPWARARAPRRTRERPAQVRLPARPLLPPAHPLCVARLDGRSCDHERVPNERSNRWRHRVESGRPIPRLLH